MKLSYHLIVCLGLAIACGCQTSGQDSRKPDRLSLLNGTERILMVDRSCKHPRVGYPHNKLQEYHYTKDTQGTGYDIEFSADGNSVKIAMDKTVEGVRASDTSDARTYNLGAGLFAGGRLVVWPTGANYEAELTIYGSGVPIIRSLRGTLATKSNSQNERN